MRDHFNTKYTPTCPWAVCSRRNFLKLASLTPLATHALAEVPFEPAANVPRAPSTIQLCKTYDYAAIRRNLAKMFDELGDVRKLVKGKFVTVKVNLVNVAEEHVQGLPVTLTVVTHPHVALALGSLLTDYGAKRVTFCDQLPYRGKSEEDFAKYGYKIEEFSREMEGKVRFANTRNLGEYKQYATVKVPHGFIAKAWEVNKTYTDTDVIVSLGKLKSHVSGGITAGMKNLFGVPPSSMYGEDLKDEPDENATGYRGAFMHSCERKPLTSTQHFTGKTVVGDHGFNVPRFIVDLNDAFPVELVVIDGISTIQSAEGWWLSSMVSVARPGLLIAGRNVVSTDAVAAAVMGFNPDAEHRTLPFANGSNCLKLARSIGLGENRLENLAIGGVGLEKAKFEFVPTYQRPRS